MASLRTTVKATPGITEELARDVRARAWAFIFDCCHSNKMATRPGGHDDAEDLEYDRTDTTIIPE